MVVSIEEVIKKFGLKDGMIIFFYYYMRNGDIVVNEVLDIIVKMGIKDFILVFSLLFFCYGFVIDYIKSGVVIGI